MDILIDTNFAVTCTKQKIDFFSLISSITEENVKWLIPKQVLTEIEELSKKSSQTIKDRQSARLFLDVLDHLIKDSDNIEVIRLEGSIVDNSIAGFCKKNPKTVLATLDKRLKSRVKNPILTIKGKSFLAIQKDINYK